MCCQSHVTFSKYFRSSGSLGNSQSIVPTATLQGEVSTANCWRNIFVDKLSTN